MLKGKVALITGGTQGIGRASAELFAREGAKIVIVGRTPEPGHQTVKAIHAAGGEASFFRGDVGKIDDLEAMVAFTAKTYGRLDVLFNNAGSTGLNSYLTAVTNEEWDEEIRTGFTSYFMACRFAIPKMLETGGGSIIMNSSVAGLQGIMMRPVYNMMKGGIVLLTKNIALDFGGQGIRANCICPGAIWTPAAGRYLENLGGELAEKVKGLVCSMVPMGRYGTADEVAQLALFLASNASSYVNGAIIAVDGGASAGNKIDLSRLS